MQDSAMSDIPVGEESKAFFSRLDWTAFWTAFVATLAVYAYTLAPTVTLEDGGELAVAGNYMGVPHPPGYPIWSLLSFFFTRIFSFVKYLGQPNPSWSIGLMSAMFGALAAGLTAMLICRSGYDILKASEHAAHEANDKSERMICWVGGVVCSLLFAFSPVMWSQSIIVEVYSLNAFFLVLVFLLVYMWVKRPSDRLLFITAFVFGLGLTNYQVLLLAALALAVAVMLRDIALFRDFTIMAIMFVVNAVILKLGSLPSTINFAKPLVFPGGHARSLIPPSYYAYIFIALMFFVAMCVAVEFLRRQRSWPLVPTLLLALGGVVLLLLLLNLPSPPPHPVPLQGNQKPFVWTIYYLGFVGAMGAMVAMCFFLPRGRMLALAFVAIELTLAVLLRKGLLLGLTHPLSWWFRFYVLLNFLVLGLGFFMLPRGRTIALSFLFAELGVAFYAYMPIVSELRNPPMNWGYPRTWEGFKHAILRGQYEKITPSDMFSNKFIHQVGAYLTDLRGTFTLPIALLGFLPFTMWQVKIAGRRVHALYAAIVLALLATFFTVLVPAVRVDKILIAGIILAMFVGGLTIVVGQLKEFLLKAVGKTTSDISERCTAGFVLLGAVAGVLLFEKMLGSNLKAVTAPLRATGEAALTGEQFHAVLGTSAGIVAFMVLPLIAIALIAWLMHTRVELRMTINANAQKWVTATLLGFLVMSVVLISLANLKLDIQDTFIQRVKFISSHALYAFWIGYGLIFGLASVDTFFRGHTTMKWLSLATALCLVPVPIHQNALNKELIRLSGGAEQNGHDFGWQFGNYQLRGAEAIMEELDPEEEPLPDPSFPSAMGTNAIFFGGTDPGRFVPTYMIYSARVREDVYLITQNALADNTYMSVMRDLYGDRIWIPAQPDSAGAFQRYVTEVQSGKRPPSAALTIQNGRVQVSGALGVMEINGILAQMIFERNNYRHDFYVEESYVIRWMYPYLEPHGLIMKINRERGGISRAKVHNDLDFWDWYTRRLTANPKFIRDIVGRKSFSKLRSAIGGLYASRGQFQEAENAFKEARILYPLSPEANFRLVQEVLMPHRRFAESRDIMTQFSEQDPGNDKVPNFIGYLDRMEKLGTQIQEFEKRMPKGQLDVSQALELAELYRQAGLMGQFAQITQGVLGNTNLPAIFHFRTAKLFQSAKQSEKMVRALDQSIDRVPEETSPGVYVEMARMYAEARNPKGMKKALGKYLERTPNDWRAWIDMASLELVNYRNTNEASRCLSQAIRAGGNEAITTIEKDSRLKPIHQSTLNRARSFMGSPGINQKFLR